MSVIFCFVSFLGDYDAVPRLIFLQDLNPVQRHINQGFTFSVYSYVLSNTVTVMNFWVPLSWGLYEQIISTDSSGNILCYGDSILSSH
jgi:hypothetical protein